MRFAPFFLDRDHGTLMRGREEIALRPKTWALLCYLIERPGRLASDDERRSGVAPRGVFFDATGKLSQGELEEARAMFEEGSRARRGRPPLPAPIWRSAASAVSGESTPSSAFPSPAPKRAGARSKRAR